LRGEGCGEACDRLCEDASARPRGSFGEERDEGGKLKAEILKR
jgi:hypothetical protein